MRILKNKNSGETISYRYKKNFCTKEKKIFNFRIKNGSKEEKT